MTMDDTDVHDAAKVEEDEVERKEDEVTKENGDCTQPVPMEEEKAEQVAAVEDSAAAATTGEAEDKDSIVEQDNSVEQDDGLETSKSVDVPKKSTATKSKKIAKQQWDCEECKRVFKTLKGKRIHKSTCKKLSALKAQDISNGVSEMSDADPDSSANVSLNCVVCDREFRNVRGRRIHEFTCKKFILGANEQAIDNVKGHRDANRSYNLRDSSSAIFYEEESEEGGVSSSKAKSVSLRKKIQCVKRKKGAFFAKKNGKYQCAYCVKKFSSNYSLRVHLRFHTAKEQDGEGAPPPQKRFKVNRLTSASGSIVKQTLKKLRIGPSGVIKARRIRNIPYFCTQCSDVSFTKLSLLYAHMQDVHDGAKPYTCNVCGVGFFRKHFLVNHSLKCTGLKCPGLKLVKKEVRDVEEEEDVADEDKMECQCSDCGKILSSKANLLQHMVVHTGKGIPCPVCDKAFGRRSNMYQHCVKVHGWPPKTLQEINVKPIVCAECGLVFQSQEERAAHIEECHERVDRKVAPLKLKINGKTCKTLVFRCKPCKVEFLNGQLLEEHFVTCGAQSDKKFRCKVCKMGFLNKSGLSSHFNIKHRGRKPFACSHCKKTFVMNHHMMAHFRYAHAASKPHLCKICNKDFIFIWDLKKHMKGHAKGAFKNGGKKVARGPKLERKFDPFLEEDEDESTVGEEEEEIFPDVPLETSRQKGRESAEDRESIARDVEDNLRLQLMEQKRTVEAELERALEEQRCLSNKRIEIYKNVVENLQEKNANATKLISGVKSVLKDVSKKLLTKDQALNEYEDRICKYKNRLRWIEESEVEFRLAWEAMENSKDQQESANLAETDGDSAPSSDGSKCVNSVWDRSEMKEKMRSSWMKLSDRIRNKSSDSSENDL